MANHFYVYELIDPRNGMVFYVGKGCGKRIEQHAREAAKGRVSNPAKYSRIKAIHDEGLKVIERIVESGLTEREALATERRLIAEGKETLTNVSHGSYAVEDILLEHAKIGIERCELTLYRHRQGHVFEPGWIEATEAWLSSLRQTVKSLAV
ncbi:GIY-YIG nuclease family protein [Rhizobium rhizogenes]|uniref:GIY-YIG nuclease family protein n=1 Tax=Rhizobium rhizogenes TaxID=359 RepID=UPI001571F8F4|nr:GIY-YIG nuclease family protein [Rhizobium rhizogenes]NTG07137.1 GIY-YIG nuclease family protein [Rhizobium rhizogenes]